MTARKETGFTWFAQDSMIRQRVEVMASKVDPLNPNNTIIMRPMELKSVERMALVEEADVTMSLTKDEAKQLCLELCRLGYGPDTANESARATMQAHIDDLRSISFQLLEMDP